MVEPLPGWAKWFFGLLVGSVMAVIAWASLQDQDTTPLPAYWEVDSNAMLDPSTTRVPLRVRERSCASGRSANGRVEAEVRYGEDSVEVTIGVRPLGGDQDCQGNPVTPFDLELTEPLGDRQLLGEQPIDR